MSHVSLDGPFLSGGFFWGARIISINVGQSLCEISFDWTPGQANTPLDEKEGTAAGGDGLLNGQGQLTPKALVKCHCPLRIEQFVLLKHAK